MILLLAVVESCCVCSLPIACSGNQSVVVCSLRRSGLRSRGCIYIDWIWGRSRAGQHVDREPGRFDGWAYFREGCLGLTAAVLSDSECLSEIH